ncbi:hypothetical protein [Paenibacillus sp. 481]|nr:hypothetical protein [Paenibacillus sp. 481]
MDKVIMLITALTNLAIAVINAWLLIRKKKEKDADRGNGQRPE